MVRIRLFRSCTGGAPTFAARTIASDVRRVMPASPPCSSAWGEGANSSATGIDKNPRNRARPPRTGAAGERVARKPRQEPADGDAALEPRHVEAGADVGARAEGQVAVGLARDVEPVGIGELGGVAVGGADADGDEGAGRHGDAADLDVARRGHAVAELVGALEAQDLLHRGRGSAPARRSGAPSPRAIRSSA